MLAMIDKSNAIVILIMMKEVNKITVNWKNQLINLTEFMAKTKAVKRSLHLMMLTLLQVIGENWVIKENYLQLRKFAWMKCIFE